MRIPMRAQVICIAEAGTSRGVTWNISQNGIQVEVPELPIRATVRLTFRLPLSDKTIDVSGAVVWASGRRHGIKFKQLGEQSHNSIRHFIDERKTEDYLH